MEGKISPAVIVLPALGLGLVGALGLAYLARAAPPEPEPVTTVALKHPPPEATMWSLTLTDWDITVTIRFIGWNGKERLDITEPATFEIPSGVQFPLRIVALQLTKWREDGEALIQLYYVQSFRPYLWDFETMEWSDTPDPDYREAFIPSYGGYFFNVATGQFEPAI